MYKHNCVECLTKHHLRCIWNISFINRFFGTKEVLLCPEYVKIIENKNEEIKRYKNMMIKKGFNFGDKKK